MIKDFIKDNKTILIFTVCVFFLFMYSSVVFGAIADGVLLHLNMETVGVKTYNYTNSSAGAFEILSGGSSSVTGKIGNAINLSGGCIRSDVQNNAWQYIGVSGPYSICYWLKKYQASTDGTQTYFSTNNAAQQYILLNFQNNGENLKNLHNTGGTAAEGIDPPNGVWTFVCSRYAGFGGVQNVSFNTTTYSNQVATKLSGNFGYTTIGCDYYTSTPRWHLNGAIDEMTIWNRSITDAEISTIYNNGAGLAFPFTATTDVATLTMETRLRNNVNVSSFIENVGFMIYTNYSVNGKPVSTANCTFAGGNMSSFFFVNNSNISLTGNNAVTLNVSSNSLHTPSQKDEYRFRVCKESPIGKNIQIYINGGLLKTISGSIIPTCIAGYTEVFNSTIAYASGTAFNISILCPTCTVGNSMRIIAYTSFNDVIEHYRVYNPHPNETMIWNTSLSLYQADDYHVYPNAGYENITIMCTNTSAPPINYSRGYIIGDNSPIAELFYITDSAGIKIFTNGINVESGNISIIGGCSNDFIIKKNLTVTYSNNTVVSYSPTESIDIDSVYLAEDTIYNVTLTCTDDENNLTSLKYYFNLADTTKPIITWVSPILDNSTVIYQNQTLNIDVTSSDLNLFSMEVICKDSLGVIKYSNYSENLSQVFQVMGTSSQITNLGQGECNVTVKDKHTDNDITDKNIIEMQDKDRLSFIYGGVKLNITASGFSPENFVTKRETDRITFYPEVSIIPSELTYYTDCENGKLLYYDDGAYDGKNRFGKYFNCGDLWIDYYMPNVPSENYHVTVISSSRAKTTIRLPTALIKGTLTPLITNSEELMTRSVGVRNIVSEYVSFNVTAQPEMPETPDLLTTPGAILLGVLSLLWIAMVAFGFLFMPILTYIGGLFGIFLAFLFMTTYTTMGIVFIFVNILLMFFNYIATSGTEE